MNRTQLGLAAALVVTAAGCGGDTGNDCGPGTHAVDGVCTPDDTGSGAMCGPGTKDDGTGTCVVDPDDCQDGTVLIGNTCVDPSHGLTIDLEEGAEPNGLGNDYAPLAQNVEFSTTPAGTIALKPSGPFVVHGHITPFRDANHDGQLDADYDTYRVTVTAPTLLDVSVDGVHGADGAFVAVATDGALAHAWERYGVNLGGDTSKRQLLLPAAGTYDLTVGDTRSMFLDANSPPGAGSGGAAGSADAEYYMSISIAQAPAPIALTPTNGVATDTGTITGDLVFYTVAMGAGFNDVVVDMPQSQANAALVVTLADQFRVQGTETRGDVFTPPAPAEAALAGVDPSDAPVIAVDFTYNTVAPAAQYTIRVAIGAATPLPGDGTTASQTEISSFPQQTRQFNAFYYDVAAADEVDAFDVHWNHPVDGAIVDQNQRVIALLTSFSGSFFGNTYTDYRGLVRHPAPGRYYFIAYDPAGIPGTDTLDVTGRFATRTPATITENTPLAGQPVDPIAASELFTYDAGTTDFWQDFDITGTGTGNRDAAFYNPHLPFGTPGAAYGALDAVTTSFGVFPPDPLVSGSPVFGHTFAAAPSAIGRILSADPTHDYLVHVTTENPTGTLDLSFRAKPFHDLGPVTSSTTATSSDGLTATATRQFYLFVADPGTIAQISLPSPAAANLEIVILNNDESAKTVVDNGDVGGTDSITLAQSGAFVAFAIDSTLPIDVPIDYTVTVAGVPPFYSAHDSATAFDDACTGGTTVTLSDDDDGVSDPIDAPDGFAFYGEPASQLIVSSNGFLSFHLDAGAGLLNNPIPDGIGQANIAPVWDDLQNVVVCTKTVGNKLVVQWTGNHFMTTMVAQAQAILDPADGSIELVWGPDHQIPVPEATVGVQDTFGAQATSLPAIAPATSQKLTHP